MALARGVMSKGSAKLLATQAANITLSIPDVFLEGGDHILLIRQEL